MQPGRLTVQAAKARRKLGNVMLVRLAAWNGEGGVVSWRMRKRRQDAPALPLLLSLAVTLLGQSCQERTAVPAYCSGAGQGRCDMQAVVVVVREEQG